MREAADCGHDAIADRLQRASRELAAIDPARIDHCLELLADSLMERRPTILEANRLDVAAAEAARLKPAMLDRLRLDDSRVEAMANAVRSIRRQSSPLGRVIARRTLPNGLELEKVSAPLGVVLFIYESRPNVTTDAAAICLKSGNAVCLRGGSEARRSNAAIAGAIDSALSQADLPRHAVAVLDDPDRSILGRLLKMNDAIDLVIPRGGESLIRAVAAESTIPVLKHFQGVCHVYVDRAADLEMALRILENAKCQRPGVCNAAETLLVHRDAAPAFLPVALQRLRERGVEIRGCPECCRLVDGCGRASEADFGFEFLDLILAVRVVDSLQEAIDHIDRYGSGHTDAIVTADAEAAGEFLRRVDSSVVLHNASTRFNDGGEIGLGAEIGISTDKLHARGPCGVDELTTYKYIIRGNGQIRSS